MVPESDLELGQLRLLDVDNRVVVPVDTHIRFIVTGQDVIHDFAVPSLGVKMDAIPGDRIHSASIHHYMQEYFYPSILPASGLLKGTLSSLCFHCV